MSNPQTPKSDVDDMASLNSQLRCLQNRVKELESENARLLSAISNCNCQSRKEKVNANDALEESKEKEKLSGVATRPVHQYPRRYVALKVMYFGQRFYAFASEAHMEPTVESEIFNALKKAKLIDIVDKKELHYSRCGRTDKGVSSVGQVIALILRSNMKRLGKYNEHAGKFLPEELCEEELDYVGMINKVLPNDIRVMGWSPAPVDFSASLVRQTRIMKGTRIMKRAFEIRNNSLSVVRFSCWRREYKYFFWKENLNIMEMEIAGKKFVGEHDFRNFCKMNARSMNTFERHIMDFKMFPSSESFEGNGLWVMNFTGSAFLWHQIRCMVAVLLLIGQGLESANVIDALLDVAKTPRKPIYLMASEVPLVLQSCDFEGLRFTCPSGAKQALHEHLKNECRNYKLQSAIFCEALQSCSATEIDNTLMMNTKVKRTPVYVPIMNRLTEPSYEERRAKFGTSDGAQK